MKTARFSHGILTISRKRSPALLPGSRFSVSAVLAFGLCALCPGVAAQSWQSLDSIASTAIAHARASLSTTGLRVESTVKSLDSRLKLPQCDQPIKGFTPGSNAGLRQNVVIGVRCTGSKPWKIYVPVKLSVYRQVLVTERPLNRGAVISAADIRTEERDVASVRSAYLTDPDQLEGKVLKRSVPEGRLVTIDLLNEEDIVKRGQRVTLMVDQRGLKVQMAGIALSDGAVNERVRVENQSSKRTVEGIVRSPQLVEVISY